MMETLPIWAILIAVLLIFIASQLFWIGRILDLGERSIPGNPRRVWLAIIVVLVYLFFVIYSYPEWANTHTIRASDYRLQSKLIYAAFWWWFVGSMLAFVLIVAFGILDRATRAAAWMYRKIRQSTQRPIAAADSAVPADPLSPARRRFLQQTAVVVSATPFVAACYGLLYERVNVEVVRQRIRLARLPKAFEAFRIALLSDIHVSPFATAGYIRRCVTMTNGLKPDLIALTGDYVAWDPQDQVEVVRVLAGLRAPHGVFGCMGNHEADIDIEDSITQLFAGQGIRMLRQQRAPIRIGDAMINLIGIDHGNDVAPVHKQREEFRRRLQQLKALVVPDTVNILLIHYPGAFGYPGLGIDLTLAGDIHGGGQLSLDSVHRGLNLARLMGVPYARGWHEKNGAQLYMNRGIGTTGFPIRLGARPEITLLELTRA
jgi:predicted MPP superfamily phosphohydrolase